MENDGFFIAYFLFGLMLADRVYIIGKFPVTFSLKCKERESKVEWVYQG